MSDFADCSEFTSLRIHEAPSFKVTNVFRPELLKDGLLIRTPNWLGDAVMTFPAMYQLKKALPRECGLFVLCPAGLAGIYKAMPIVDFVLPLEDVHAFPTKFEMASIMNLQPGLAVVFNNSLRDVLSLKLAFVPRVYGASARFRSVFLSRSFRFPPRLDRTLNKPHHAAKYLSMAYALGAPEWRGDYPEINPAKEKELIKPEIQKILASDKLLSVAAGAAYGDSKRWSSENFNKVCRYWIEEQGGSIVCLGSGKERSIGEKVVESLDPDRAFNACGSSDMDELVMILKKSSLCIANDSGVMHLAASLGVPGIAVFGSTDPSATAPVSPLWKVLFKKQECSPCFKRTCPLGNSKCMSAVEAADLVNIIKSQGIPSLSALEK